MARVRPILEHLAMRIGGAPDVVCTKCDPPRRAVSYRTLSGVATEYVCECCGFAWCGENGTDAKGNTYKRNMRGVWERTYK